MNTPRIGHDSRVVIGKILSVVRSQGQSEFPEVETSLKAANAALEACHVRISVVGQVKAGKSSLINMLSGIEDLLPTEVNPWTAVITNLHFGHTDKPGSGGEFQFFSAGEWQQVLEGDQKTRALAEDLLPGFDTSLLQNQAAEMQASAQKRLGSLYHHLLGKKHRFNSITPEILERYVSAGHPDQDEDMEDTENAGRFSGITKSAEVFLDAGPFAIPVTVSDTPGINDPFLVRDEITTSSFRNTDIFIVALSIHQALGAADMALLKMLSRHGGKSTVIFVNRIDEVDDPATDVYEVMDALKQKLDIDLGGADYTLLAGSAEWAHTAKYASDDDVAATAAPEAFKAYFSRKCGKKRLTPRNRVLVASGLPELGKTLTKLIAEGPVKRAVSAITSDVIAAVGMHEALLRKRAERDEVVVLDVGDIPAILEAEKNRLIAKVNGLADLADELDADEGETREKVLNNGQLVSQSIVHTIEATLGHFVDAQAVELGAAFSTGTSGTKWSLDTADLNQKIEEQTIESFRNGRDEMDRMLGKFGKATDKKISGVLTGIDISSLLENLPHDEIFPGFKASSTLVDIELVNERGWKFWKTSEMTKDEAIARVQAVIRQEMLPAVNACCDSASLAIAERSGEALARISSVKAAARQLIVDEVTTLKEEIETFDTGVNTETVQRINSRRAARAKIRRKQIDELAKLGAQLAESVGPVAIPSEAPTSEASSKAGPE